MNRRRSPKISAVFIFLVVLSVFSLVPARAAAVPGTLVAKLKPDAPSTFFRAFGAEPVFLYDRVYRLRVADKAAVLSELKNSPAVEFAAEDGLVKTRAIVNDYFFSSDAQDLSRQWYLRKMQTPEAWAQTVGSGIIVAVVDTGIDGRHEDLNDGRVIKGYANYCQTMSQGGNPECLVRNTGELPANVNSDDNGHGTIVAGILGAIANNNKGIAGINWNVRLMPIKALDSTGTGLASDVAAGIRWATDNGARIVNLSVGGSGLQGIEVLQDAISYAFKKGVLIVAAAGNDAAEIGGDLNAAPVLPACADGGQNMIIGVAAVDGNDRKARFSNYGSNCVDIAAPGTGIFVDKQQKQGLVSTYYDPSRPGDQNLYVFAIGTSVAAPMVSGVAALAMSAFPNLDVKGIRDRLIGSVDNIDDLNQTACNGGSCTRQLGLGRINAVKAVTMSTAIASGTLVKDPYGKRFLIENGLKRPISEFVYKQRFPAIGLIDASVPQLEGFPIGLPLPPVDGTILKEPTNPTVYLMEGGERQALSYLAFISRGLRFENVVTLPSPEVASYPRTQDAPVMNGVLMKASGNPAVFILNNGLRQLLSYFVFQQRGFQNMSIGILSLEELAIYPMQSAGFLYPPLDGTLIRGEADPTVYLVEGGKLRGLTLAAFQGRGFRFADVHVLPQSEVDSYQRGAAIWQ